MVAMLVYGEPLKISSPELRKLEAESWYTSFGTQSLLSFLNDDTRVTFDLFTVWSNVPLLLWQYWKKLHGICRYTKAVFIRRSNRGPSGKHTDIILTPLNPTFIQ